MQMILPYIVFFTALLLMFGAIVLVALLFSSIFFGQLRGAPYVPSKRSRAKRMVELAELQPQDRVADLGSGDGVIVLAAAREGARTVGIELNPMLVWLSRARIRIHKLEAYTKIIRINFYDYPLHDTTVVFVYLLGKTLASLEKKFERELPLGARIVSNGFRLPHWQPIYEEDNIFIYKKV